MTAGEKRSVCVSKPRLPIYGKIPFENFVLRRKICKVLRDLGVPEHLTGYNYLVEAVMMASQEPVCLRKMTTFVYPYIGQKHLISAAAVERAMRHAVETACLRCDPDALFSFFGNTIDPNKGKPSNSEFIARVAGAVRQEVLS